MWQLRSILRVEKHVNRAMLIEKIWEEFEDYYELYERKHRI